ncbi:MAG TPA: GGDEF domain-containing protein [Candidatus Eisenbacteria bacterium]|nr:GGDEF domain-containing protein [Candidatus Eisenbacteria bacterium]
MDRYEPLSAALDECAALMDEQTGLYNRIGFLSLARQMANLARRRRRDLLVVRADLDGLQAINDRFGEAQGNLALADAVDILARTFRKSDVLSRLDGDNFLMMAIETRKDSGEVITSRLKQNLERYNASATRPYRLSLTAAAATFDPETALSPEELVDNTEMLLRQAS